MRKYWSTLLVTVAMAGGFENSFARDFSYRDVCEVTQGGIEGSFKFWLQSSKFGPILFFNESPWGGSGPMSFDVVFSNASLVVGSTVGFLAVIEWDEKGTGGQLYVGDKIGLASLGKYVSFSIECHRN